MLGRCLLVLSIVPLGLSAAACRQDPAVAKQRYLESGDRYAKSGKHAEAAIEYKNALQQDPGAGDVHARLADALLGSGDLGGAVGEYVLAADLRPADVPLQLKAGNFLLLAGRFDDAKALAEKLLAIDQRNVDAEILLANALAGLKDIDGALAQIEDALRASPNRSGTYSSLGTLELTRGRRDAAEAAFKKAVELQPDSLQANVSLGNYYWLTGESAKAEKFLKRALDLDPRSMLTNRALANFYLATRRSADAEQPLKAIAELTKTTEASLMLADYYLSAGNEPAAKAILQPMANEPGTSQEANVRLASLDYRNGRAADAYRRLTDVLERDQFNLQALLTRTALLVSDHRLEEARAAALLAAEHHPQSTAAQFTLGRVHVALRENDKAIAAFQEVLRLNPRITEAAVVLSQLHLEQGRPDVSMGFARDALALEPDNADAKLTFVRGLLAKGELARAESELTPLLGRFPNSAAVHAQMGVVLTQKRSVAAARAEFERALQLQPTSDEATAGLVNLDLISHDYARAHSRVDAQAAAHPTAASLTVAARTYAATGDLVVAEQYLRRAIEAESAYLPAYVSLGQLYLAQQKLTAGREEFELLAKRSPKSVGAHTMIGIILQAEGRVDEARERFERVMQLDPEAAVAANNLAWIYADKGGNLDLALQLAQTAQKHLPDSAEVNDTLGFVLYKKDLAAQAISSFKLSTEQSPRNALYHYHLGLAYASAGNTASSRRSLRARVGVTAGFCRRRLGEEPAGLVECALNRALFASSHFCTEAAALKQRKP